MSARHARSRGDDGFTLVELLLTIAISAIVLSTITLAVAQGFSTTSQAAKRLDRSNLADFAAKRFGADAAASAPTQPGPVCGTGTTALDLAQSDGSWISYSVTSDGPNRYALERRICDGVDPGSGDAVVTRLGSATSPTSPTTTGSACPSGSATTCTLTVTWSDGSGDFTLTGTRRAG